MANKYHLVYCYVPKIGSSFWKRVLAILDGDVEGNKTVFNLSSVAIHDSPAIHHLEGRFFEMYNTLQSSKKFMFVRDPYERLFSGYIDKYFCPCYYSDSYITSKFRVPAVKRGKCQPGVNFTEFLLYVTNMKGVPVDEHFEDQCKKCLPCQIRYDYIGKMETFRQDSEFILRSVHAEPSLVLGPNEEFEESSDVNIMNDVTKNIFGKCRHPSNKCVSKYQIMLRLWVTLQVSHFLP